MTKKTEDQRFEFILYRNKNIVCQRYFSVNNFNQDSIYSLELKELMDNLVGMNVGKYTGQYSGMGIIPSHLKKKSIDYLWKFYNPHNIYQQKFEEGRNIFEKEDTFDFEITVDRYTVAESTFCGNFFPQQIRWQVDIKELIPSIISEIKSALSKKSYTTEYADVEF